MASAAPMSDEEREQLLRHLKIKWAAVNVEYQKLGFVMDIGAGWVVLRGQQQREGSRAFMWVVPARPRFCALHQLSASCCISH